MEEKKIIDYIIIESNNTKDIGTRVLEKLKDGYVLLGGVSCSGEGYVNSMRFVQAMVKYEK